MKIFRLRYRKIVLGIVLFLVGAILLSSHVVEARRVRGDFGAPVTFMPLPSWSYHSESEFSFADTKRIIEDVLTNDPEFISETLSDIFGRTVALSEVAEFYVNYDTGGTYTKIMRIDVVLRSGEKKSFCLNISSSSNINDEVEQDFDNLEILYERNPSYIVKPIAMTYSSNTKNSEEACVFSTYWHDYIEIILSDEEGLLSEWSGEQEDFIDLTPEKSSRIREEMVKILTLYYDSEGRTMMGYDSSVGFTLGASVNAGDFMLQREGQDIHLLLVTARQLAHNVDIPSFVDALLSYSGIKDHHSIRVFEPQEVFSGITKGLVELYGKKQGVKLAKQWFRQYRHSAEEDVIIGDEFIDELDAFLKTLTRP
ncbi:MAG: hypothetical protein NTZ48_00575 [Candidatus Omnitrophica bacterium]|nr:hypothetical protein [Candidatus Omnitrophota bacterium]